MTIVNFTPVSALNRKTGRALKKIVNKYANQVNSQFSKSNSHYVDMAQRLKDAVNNTWYKQKLEFAMNQYTSSYPHIKAFSDIKLVKTLRCKLNLIDIDVTLQRLLDVEHAVNILQNFEELLVMPISVYEDATHPGRYVCWDGQHTAIVLYIIACQILGEDPAQVDVPINIYESSLKSDMRNNFIKLNGEAKKPLDVIDIFHQMVFGVRTDNATYPEWIIAEKKQQALEANGMFATHSKFNDTDRPGALSNLTEFATVNLELAQAFCTYFNAVCQSKRPVESKEPWMLLMYFDLCREQNIKLTEDMIIAVADALNAGFPDGFDPDELYDRAQTSYEEWWRINKPNPDGNLTGITRHRKNDTLVFLIAQIKKYIDPTVEMPHTRIRYNRWQVPAEDLF